MSFERYFGTNVVSNACGIYEFLIAFILLDIALNIYYRNKLLESYRFSLPQ